MAITPASGNLVAGALLVNPGTAKPAVLAASGTLRAGGLLVNPGTATPAVLSASGTVLAGGLLVNGGTAQPAVFGASGNLVAGGLLVNAGTATPAIVAVAPTALVAGAQLTGAGAAQPALFAASPPGLMTGALLMGAGAAQRAITVAAGSLYAGAVLMGAAVQAWPQDRAIFRAAPRPLLFRAPARPLVFRSTGGTEMPMQPIALPSGPYVLRSGDKNIPFMGDFGPDLQNGETLVSATARVLMVPTGSWSLTPTDVTTTVVPGAATSPASAALVVPPGGTALTAAQIVVGPGAVKGQSYVIQFTVTTSAGRQIEDSIGAFAPGQSIDADM